ncbi:hypothetical protein DE146DRAFT_460078 [Phaeosphaeria sp. MPI-PUGE-AT-0046c]|nr:hypothetical protein DE146DRAFT_460078 [Phaeosphaeria sp. MPI-PUGE-AT-0046c]
MVSRGGRSKGCAPCRRRKVKCDQTRPVCIRCKKRGDNCDGPRQLEWIYQNQATASNLSPGRGKANMSLPTEVSIAGFEKNICLAFTRKTLFRGGPVELACDMIDFDENASIFSRRPELSLLRGAILSLAVTYFGNQHHDQRIVSKGYSQYGQVLQQLNSALAVPARQTSNEVLLTAFTCMLVELFSPRGPVNFLKHQRGIEAMMRLRGPPTESMGETATLFRGLRVMSIVSALVDRRPSIYASEPWNDAPVSPRTDIGGVHHELLAVLAACTQLLSDCNASLASKSEAPRVTELLARADSAMVDLEALYLLWATMNEKELLCASKASYLVQDLAIANHLSATAYMLYHATSICILQIKQSLEPTASNVKLREDAAIKIARCLELKEREKQEGMAPLSTAWSSIATRVVWQALGGFETDFETEGERRLARAVEAMVT